MDVADVVWDRFFADRHKPLNIRFPGIYRAIVVEVNDPLCMNRVRFKCPELHDDDLKPEECPWAVPCFSFGGKQAGNFVSPTIGDWIAIAFEKQHPYAPMWIGFLNPTLRRNYTLAQIANKTPVAIDDAGTQNKVKDYDEAYLPKDGRPMVYGYEDRYGNMDYSSSVGYYPKEHETAPPPPDLDPISKKILVTVNTPPEQNKPDKKYIVRATRYGHIMIMGDQGYSWKKDGEYGDISNTDEDVKTNANRFLYLQKLFNANKPDSTIAGGDQRRIETLTRYGHKIEMRDVGWAQPGPVSSKSREGEYSDPSYLSRETQNDERWIKIRTKGGMLIQAYDKGLDPQNDNYVKRLLLDETGTQTEQEDVYWKNKDARFIRIVTRHGYKLVLDDRGSSTTASETDPTPTGNGILLKGRRIQGCSRGNGDRQVGYYFEMNENDTTNHSSWGSPLGQQIEINDKHQYMMLASRLGDDWAMEWQGLKENEFIGKPMMQADPEHSSHHLKIDADNEYIRFKTRANKGSPSYKSTVSSGVGDGAEHQGFEAHDGSNGDGPWVELVDCENRGFWFSKKYSLGVWRSSSSNNMYTLFDDKNKQIVIHNNEATGVVEIYSARYINIISDLDINIRAGRSINMLAGDSVNIGGSASRLTVSNVVKTNTQVRGLSFLPVPGANQVVNVNPTTGYTNLMPSDRAKTYNGPFDAADRAEIEHPI